MFSCSHSQKEIPKVKAYDDIKPHEEENGFIWYAANIDGKVVALDAQKRQLWEPFKGEIESYSVKENRFYTRKYYYSSDGLDSCFCRGLYESDGSVVIAEDEGYVGINYHDTETESGTHPYYLTMAVIYDGKIYHGAVDYNGNLIIPPFSTEYIHQNKAFGDEPMLVGRVSSRFFYTFLYINNEGIVSSYGECLDILDLREEKELTEEGWINSYYTERYSPGEYSHRLYILENCLFVEGSPYYPRRKYDEVGIEDGYTIYRDDEGHLLYIALDGTEVQGQICTRGGENHHIDFVAP